MRRMLLSLALLALPLARADAQSTANASYAGVYRDAPRDYIVIAPLSSGEGAPLLFAETRTEQLRLIFPAGKDTFTTGPTLTQPAPRERTLAFTTSLLSITRIENAPAIQYPRIVVRQEQVQFRSGDVTLHGTLLIPPHRRGRSAIVMAHGSENSDRDSFGPLPWVLAGDGYVVLTYDKRGTGRSSGSWQTVGVEPLAQDLAAAVDYVASRKDIDALRIGVVATSEGGWVAANAAQRTKRIAAIAAISGGARTKGDAYIHKSRQLALEAGLRGQQLDSAVAAATATIQESARRVTNDSTTVSGFDRRVTYDPTADWRRFRGAFLYLGGAADVLEDATKAARWFDRLFSATRHSDFTLKVMPDAHHSLIHAIHGTPSEFAKLSGLRELVPGYWSVLLHWLDARLNPRVR